MKTRLVKSTLLVFIRFSIFQAVNIVKADDDEYEDMKIMRSRIVKNMTTMMRNTKSIKKNMIKTMKMMSMKNKSETMNGNLKYEICL